jgi:hypothetical protein
MTQNEEAVFPYEIEPFEVEDFDSCNEAQEAFRVEHEIAVRRSEYLPADSLRNLFLRPFAPITCYIPKIVYAGAVTIVAADPKAGKTTFLLHALGALSVGKQFLNDQLSPVTVLYASEQSEVSFRKQAEKLSHLKESDNFRVLLFEDNLVSKTIRKKQDNIFVEEEVKVPPSTWDEQIAFWQTAIDKNNPSVFVIDTFTAFSNFKAGEAFDPGVVHARLQALKVLLKSRPNLAIVILHHLRKEVAGGNQTARTFGDIANSYALRAGTDQNVLLFAPNKKKAPNVRSLMIEGRFVDSEEEIQVELTPDGFQLRNAQVEDDKRPAQELILEAVSRDPELNNLVVRDLADRLGISTKQVQLFRQKFPKGCVPNRGQS